MSSAGHGTGAGARRRPRTPPSRTPRSGCSRAAASTRPPSTTSPRRSGIGRRTLFRYFPSKNDIPWGRFDDGLSGLRASLAAMPDDVPVLDAVHRAVLEFNQLDDDATEQHRQRMTLLLTTPALQAHSVLRYAQWREVIAEYAADAVRTRRRRPPAAHHRPREPGPVALGVRAVAARARRPTDRPALADRAAAAQLRRRGRTARLGRGDRHAASAAARASSVRALNRASDDAAAVRGIGEQPDPRVAQGI